MAIIPHIQYLETKAMLTEKIRGESNSILEEEADKHTCYFCNKRIHGKMMVIPETFFDMGVHNIRYYVGMDCYEEAKKHPELVKYEITTPLCMN